MRGGNAEALDELFGLAAAWNLADGEAMDRETGVGDGFRDGVADPARRVVILDGDQMTSGRAAGSDQRGAVDWLHRIQVDHTDRRPGGLQLVIRFERFEYRDAGADHRRDVAGAFAQ